MPEGKQELVAVRATQSNQIGIEGQQKQRRQMLIALGILVLALVAAPAKRLALLVRRSSIQSYSFRKVGTEYRADPDAIKQHYLGKNNPTNRGKG